MFWFYGAWHHLKCHRSPAQEPLKQELISYIGKEIVKRPGEQRVDPTPWAEIVPISLWLGVGLKLFRSRCGWVLGSQISSDIVVVGFWAEVPPISLWFGVGPKLFSSRCCWRLGLNSLNTKISYNIPIALWPRNAALAPPGCMTSGLQK